MYGVDPNDPDLMQQALIAKLRGQPLSPPSGVPSMLAAPQQPQAPQPQPDPAPQGDPQGRQRAVGLLAMLTGNKQFGGAGQGLVDDANQQQQFARQQKGIDISNAEAQQRLQQAGPQAALGGQTPEMAGLLSKLQNAAKFSVNPATGGIFNVHTGESKGGGGVSGLSGTALDQAAELFHTTGQLPSVGMGAAGSMARRQIINRAAELHPDANLAANKADYKANEGSLGGMQKTADTIDAFEKTSLGNLQNFLNVSQKATDTGSPIVNQPLRWFTGKVLGDPDIAAYHAARQVAVQEIGKVLGGAVAGGAISDSQRKEVEGLLPPDASGSQVAAVAKILIQDMATRKASVGQQLQTIRGRMGAQPTPAGAPDPAAAPQPAPASLAPGVRKFTRVNGKLTEIK